MTGIVRKYKSLTPQSRASIYTLISVCWNGVLAVGKIIFAIFKGTFFFVSGCINVFWALAKFECFNGLKKYSDKTFKYRNIAVATYVLLADVEYTVYMLALIFWDRAVMNYTDFLAINIAFIAFVEVAIAIKGLFSIKNKGHYYRDIKFINFCSALTAIMWAEVALITFVTGEVNRLACGLSGLFVGIVIICVAIYIYFAPKISLIDREHNVYKAINNKKEKLTPNEENKILITLLKSKIYGNYEYNAIVENGVVDGHISKTKSEWGSLNICWKILIIILSEILIFAYAVGALIYFFKTINIIPKLDKTMLDYGYKKIKVK